MNKSDTICPTCGDSWIRPFYTGNCRDPYHGKAYNAPAIKMGEQTWYKDGHHPTPAPDTYSPGFPVESETPGNPGNTQPDEPLEPQYKSETTVQAKSAGVEQYQPVFDTQPGDEQWPYTFGEKVRLAIIVHCYATGEGPDEQENEELANGCQDAIDEILAAYEAERQAAYTQGRRDELEETWKDMFEHGLLKGDHGEDNARILGVIEARIAALQEKPNGR